MMTRVCCLNCGATMEANALSQHFGSVCSIDRMAFRVI